MTKDEAITLEALKYAASVGYGLRGMKITPFTIKGDEALAQPAQDWKTLPKKDAPLVEWAKEQTPPAAQYEIGWNAALDEAAARIGEIKAFGQVTQDSFAVFIKGLKK